jgi:hypothetical protein
VVVDHTLTELLDLTVLGVLLGERAELDLGHAIASGGLGEVHVFLSQLLLRGAGRCLLLRRLGLILVLRQGRRADQRDQSDAGHQTCECHPYPPRKPAASCGRVRHPT